LNSGFGNKGTVPTDNKSSAVSKYKNATAQLAPQNLIPTNPTMAAAINQEVLAAIKNIDPQNIVGIVKKSLDAMLALKTINSVSSSGGLNSMISGALGGALQQLSSNVGLENALNQLNTILPTISSSLSSSMISNLNTALNSMISSTSVGILSANSVNAAQSLANIINSASNVNSLVNTAANIGGSLLGLSVDSLASQIVNLATNQSLLQTLNINGQNISMTISPSTANIQGTLSNIPSLTGLEGVNIASSLITPTALSLITSGPSQLLNILNTLSSSIVDSGLSTVLGAPLSGLLSRVNILLPDIAANITNTLAVHVPKTTLNPQIMNNVMQQATKVLALGQMAHDISSIFTNTPAEHAQDIANSLATQVSTMTAGTNLSISIPGVGTVSVTNQGSN
jgi:hypothetical protein